MNRQKIFSIMSICMTLGLMFLIGTGNVEAAYVDGSASVCTSVYTCKSTTYTCNPSYYSYDRNDTLRNITRTNCANNKVNCDDRWTCDSTGDYNSCYNITQTCTPDTRTCHYISRVNSWTACSNGVQVAASVTWSQVAGTSCSDVATSRSCTVPCQGNIPSDSISCGDNPAYNPLSWAYVGTSAANCTRMRNCEYYTPPAACVPNTCAADTCAGQTCWNGCTTVNGTKNCAAPTLTFSASPASLPYGGGNSTLSWSTTNATSCWASNGWGGGGVNLSGNSLQGLTTTKTFDLECWNSASVSSGKKSVTVTVAACVPDCSDKNTHCTGASYSAPNCGYCTGTMPGTCSGQGSKCIGVAYNDSCNNTTCHGAKDCRDLNWREVAPN
ncbi:MAG: hypothetical protein WC823_00825 [Parcubacteria group bacterium]|jgi:hypothetical protein